MNEQELIFTIGILKGLKTQIHDKDVETALEKSIGVWNHILDDSRTNKKEIEEAGGEE